MRLVADMFSESKEIAKPKDENETLKTADHPAPWWARNAAEYAIAAMSGDVSP